jgi:hypothetical protein
MIRARPSRQTLRVRRSARISSLTGTLPMPALHASGSTTTAAREKKRLKQIERVLFLMTLLSSAGFVNFHPETPGNPSGPDWGFPGR